MSNNKALRNIVRKVVCALGISVGLTTSAIAQTTQGVTPKEIVLGSVLDLSGPVAITGKQARDALVLRVEQVNAAGGIHGRRIRLIVEDSGYDPKKSVLAGQKLVQNDKVFALVATLGTPPVMTTMPLALERGVMHLFPLAAPRAAFEPVHKYKFAHASPYDENTSIGLKYLVKQNGYKRVGILHQDDDFGAEFLRGAQAALTELNLPLIERTSYKRGTTDFSSQIARLRAANVDLVVLGTVIRETIGAVAEARKNGWNVDMMGGIPAHSTEVHDLGGKAMEGLYSISQFPLPYAAGANSRLGQSMTEYKQRFGSDPKLGSVMSWIAIDLTVKGLEAAGPNLTNDSMSAALERLALPRDFLGSPEFRFSATDHLGNRLIRISQIRNGRWEYLTDYMK